MQPFVDRTNEQDKAVLDKACARLFYDTGIPFAVAHSTAWKEYHAALRPAYQPPSSKRIRGALLDAAYQEHSRETTRHLKSSNFMHLVSDGFSNIRRQHLVNFVAHTPNSDSRPIVVDIKTTRDEAQTAQAIANDILDVIEKIGFKKVVSVVTDNAPSMRGARTIIEERHPQIICNGCAAHTLNLLVNDVSKLARFAEPLVQAKAITAFVMQRAQVLDRFRSIQ
ncbi:hypothetical protein Ae201684P_018590 [Aphanomyces euteiches]|uniref:DUF659 domain-containing protein n=1 Tax=Aphanomyces euteiches TaxID=100861 RepID=A0A6G0XUM5_9STRA|nr:hypothetical protein Ae201684_000846 [Aphanomyces euteiches]KAH9099577.1 hypothetical protein Ae201684P_018590 [Aphanomyces euteiches]KAH9146114.1 hypothetical protein AeRB84_009994 [Aphanomyces euteiches]